MFVVFVSRYQTNIYIDNNRVLYIEFMQYNILYILIRPQKNKNHIIIDLIKFTPKIILFSV